MPDQYARRHDAVMAEVHVLLERLPDALDRREQRLAGKMGAAHIARIEAVRDRLAALVADVDEI